MAYPFTDPKTDFAHRKLSYAQLSLPAPDDKGCDPNFSNSMPTINGISLDDIANHEFAQYSKKALKSCDSISLGDDGYYYLVEFKNQPSSNIDGDDIHKKIIDSLSLILFAFESHTAIVDLSKKVKAYVVFADKNAFLKIVKVVGASGSNKTKKLARPLWGLKNLVDKNFIAEVDTIPLSEFKKLVLSWPNMILP